MTKRVIIFGSRDYGGVEQIERVMETFEEGTIIVHGACRTGADAIANDIAKRLGLVVEPHPADWDKYRSESDPQGRRAGPARNREMAQAGADIAYGFRSYGKSNGTDNMARECKKAGIRVVKYGHWPIERKR